MGREKFPEEYTEARQLQKDFPNVFRVEDSDYAYPWSEKRGRCGVHVDAGWLPLLRRWAEAVDLVFTEHPELYIHQIKEKFGTLRLYTNHEVRSTLLDRATAIAEVESSHTCEVCGADGELRSSRAWVRTLCDTCAEPKKETK